MARVKVTASLFDGSTLQAEGVYMGLADRVAFERHFGRPLGGLVGHDERTEHRISLLVGKVLERLEGEDDLPEGQAALVRRMLERLAKDENEELNEEHVAFLVRRLLARSQDVADFEEFVEQVEEIKIEALSDPTEPAAQREN
jgi:hypothetical protein